MKRCNACDEEFADKFSFCPVDGTPLNSLAAALVGKEFGDNSSCSGPADDWREDCYAWSSQYEFKVTMISNAGLGRRLITEISFVIDRLQREWPDLKRDPIGSSRRAIHGLTTQLKRFVLAPHALASALTAILLVLSAVLLVIVLGRMPKDPTLADVGLDEPVEVSILTFPAAPTKPEGSGVGVSGKGRVGIAKGNGEGSEAEPKRSTGGGGGGDQKPLPAQQGKIPPPSEISAPINPPLPNATLPRAGIDLDPALWANLLFTTYGDPRSKATAASNGPGQDGGIGTGKGQGVGEGNDNGMGPGEKGNIGGGPNERGGHGPGGAPGGNDPRDVVRTFTNAEVTQRAKVISKPEPNYTEEARKEHITGTVVLRVVFSESGLVTNIHPIKSLPAGLTEKAIAAARQIRFVPASRNGQPVPVYMQLEYSFNLY